MFLINSTSIAEVQNQTDMLWSTFCDIVQGKDCHERSIAMGQNVLLLRYLCINNFNCSVDFRAFSRYTTITKNIIVFPFYVTERSAKIMQLKCLTQYKFCQFPFTVLPFLRVHLLFDNSMSTCMSTITNYHFMMLRCIFATKGSQIKQKNRHVCARWATLFIQKPSYWYWAVLACQTGFLSENGHPRVFSACSCFFSTRKSLFVSVVSWTLLPWDGMGVFPAPAR